MKTLPIRPSSIKKSPYYPTQIGKDEAQHRLKDKMPTGVFSTPVKMPTGVFSTPVLQPHRILPIAPQAIIQSINANGRVSDATIRTLNYLVSESVALFNKVDNLGSQIADVERDGVVIVSNNKKQRLIAALRENQDVAPTRVRPPSKPVAKPKTKTKSSKVTSTIVDFDAQVLAIFDKLTTEQQKRAQDLRKQINRFADNFLSYAETNTLSLLQIASYLSSIESYKQQLLEIITPKPKVPEPNVTNVKTDSEPMVTNVTTSTPTAPAIISRRLGHRIIHHITSSFDTKEQLRLLDTIARTLTPERPGFLTGEIPLLVQVLTQELGSVICPEARATLTRISDDQQDDARRHFELSGCDPDRDSARYDAEATKFQARLQDRLAAGNKTSCEGLYFYRSADGSISGGHNTRILITPTSATEVEIKLIDRGRHQPVVGDKVYITIVTVSKEELLGANGKRYFSEIFKLANRYLPSSKAAYESLHGATARFLPIRARRHKAMEPQYAPNCSWASRESEFTDRLGIDWLFIHRELIRVLIEHYQEQRDIDASSQLERLAVRSAELDREVSALVARDMRAVHSVGDIPPALGFDPSVMPPPILA
jgi:hypothetical protein